MTDEELEAAMVDKKYRKDGKFPFKENVTTVTCQS